LPPLPNTDDLDVSPESESYDCVDEILSLFRANVLFRNFEINGPADRMLIYGTLFISECLGKVKPTMNAREAEKVGRIYRKGFIGEKIDTVTSRP
jgi:actin related protein 2/3 complex subunit 3